MAQAENTLLVYITVPEEKACAEIACGLVSAGLAAGANMAGPVTSWYRWQGKLIQAREWQIFAQTTESGFEALARYVTEHHPHRVPCIIATGIAAGHPPFLEWIRENSCGKEACK